MTKDRQIPRLVRDGWILPGLTALFLCLLLALNARETGRIVTAAPPETAPQIQNTAVFAEIEDAKAGDAAPRKAGTGHAEAGGETGDTEARNAEAGERGTVPREDRLDLNSASAEELETLPGIGPVLAARIIAYREEHGPFPTAEAVMDVSGIGEGKFSAMEPFICVTP